VKLFSTLMAVCVFTTLGSSARAQISPQQIQQLSNSCTQCHANPELGAPLMGDSKHWQRILSKGEDQVILNVVNGLGSMPPMGYCSSCSEEDLRAIVRLMAAQ
jgi:cytochrome c5